MLPWQQSVHRAAVLLGNGFLGAAANNSLRDDIASGRLDAAEFSSQIEWLIHRLLFARFAEGAGLLSPADSKTPVRQEQRQRTLKKPSRRNRPTISGQAYRRFLTRFHDLTGPLKGTSTLKEGANVAFLFSHAAELEPAELDDGSFTSACAQLEALCRHHVFSDNESSCPAAPIFGAVHQLFFARAPNLHPESRTFSLRRKRGGERKSAGIYYTPKSLVDCLLDATIERPSIDPSSIAVCDPACGSGNFLVAAARRLARRRLAARPDVKTGGEAFRQELRLAIAHSIYGVDADPAAVELCKLALWLEYADPDKPIDFLDGRIKCGNSILGATRESIAAGIPDEAFEPAETDDPSVCGDFRRQNRAERQFRRSHRPRTEPSSRNAAFVADAWCAAFAAEKTAATKSDAITDRTLFGITVQDKIKECIKRTVCQAKTRHRFFHWSLEFPEIFEARGGFDVVVGNPPFVNGIEGRMSSRMRAFARYMHPRVKGAADLAYFFLDQGLMICREGGYIGFVQPRAILNARPLELLRRPAETGFHPRMLFASNRPNLFPGASIFISAVCLGPEGPCLCASSDDPGTALWREETVRSSNWWSEIHLHESRLSLDGAAGPKLEDEFTVTASMTAGDAYDLRPLLFDDPNGADLKLATTGLIEPSECLWGQATCIYLKRRLRYPRVRQRGSLGKSLAGRLENARRPKVLVAGLSSRIECFLDHAGEYVGAVSTYSIFHPEDRLDRLQALCETLLAPAATARFRLELGGNAMGGGNTTMKKDFLKALPLGRFATTESQAATLRG